MDRPLPIGRAGIARRLRERLGESTGGAGGLVLVSADAGMGKTHLLRWLVDEARDAGVESRTGECLYGSGVDPYLPFSAALGDLLDGPVIRPQEPARVEEIFVISGAGILLHHACRTAAGVGRDSDILAGMLSAVQDFVKDSFGSPSDSKEGLAQLVYGGKTVLLEHGDRIFVAALVEGGEAAGLRADLRYAIHRVESRFAGPLAGWDGNMESVAGIGQLLAPLMEKSYPRVVLGTRGDLDRERLRTGDLVLRALTAAAGARPQLLVIEDLHWADAGTLQLLHFLSRNVRHQRVLIVGTVRREQLSGSDPADTDLRELVGRLLRENAAEIIELPPLALGDVGELLRCESGTALGDETIQLLTTRCEGNPLFVLEVYRAIPSGDAGTHGDRAVFPLPPSVQDLVRGRTGRLSESAALAVRAAALIGREFPFELLVAAVGGTEESVISAMEHATAARLIELVPGSEDRYRFVHALFQEALAGELIPLRRRQIHRAIAKHLEADRRARTTALAAGIAHHFAASRDFAKAREFGILGGEILESELAVEEAIDLYREVLAALEDAPEEEGAGRRELLLRLAGASYRAGRWDEATAQYERLVVVAADAGDRERLARAELGLGRLYNYRSRWEDSRSHLAEALRMFPTIGDLGGELETKLHLLWAESHARPAGAIEGRASSLLEEARQLGDIETEAATLRLMVLLADRDGRTADAVLSARRSVQVLASLPPSIALADANSTLCHCLGAAADCDPGSSRSLLEEALAVSDQAVQIARTIGALRSLCFATVNRADILMRLGQFDGAIREAAAASDLATKIGLTHVEAIALLVTGTTHRQLGNPSEARRRLVSSIDLFQRTADTSNLSKARHELSLVAEDGAPAAPQGGSPRGPTG